MSRTRTILSMAVFAAVVVASRPASALTVNWGAPTAINSNLDIINPTGVIHAVNFTSNSQPGIINVDVGGTLIPFDSSGVVGGTGFHNDSFFVDNNPAPGVVSGNNSSEFHQVLDGFRDNSTTSFTFTGLNPGETYFVQAFQSDDRGNRPVELNIDGVAITPFTSDNSLFRSAFAIAEVTLDGGETSFKLERPGGPPRQINAAVLSQASSPQVTPNYSDEVLADNPVLYYRFEEGFGDPTAVDSTGNGNDGTYVNNPTLGNPSGFIGLGNAVELDGVNQRIDTNALNGQTQLGQASVEAWVNVDALSTACCTSIFSTDAFGNGNLHFNLKPGLDIEHAIAGGSPNNVNTPNGVIDFDQWAHIVATYDAAGGGETLIYVNGSLVGTGIHNSGIFSNFTAGNIGSFNAGRFFNGEIDEFAIYDTILTPQRIADHFRARNSLGAGVPEPTTATLGLIGLAGLLVRRRRAA